MSLRICIIWVLLSMPLSAETLRLAVTTSFENSGLSDLLLPAIHADLGLDIELLVVGTGQALRLGRAGDVDAVLVHAPKAEIAFVDSGYGVDRVQIMANNFVLIGPRDDPAQVATAKSAHMAFSRIASTQQRFISRGDNSGTHQKEQELWQGIGLSPEGEWYFVTGSSMGAALNIAVSLNAYTLSDSATWRAFANKGDLMLLYGGDPLLFNPYSLIAVSPARHPHVAYPEVLRLRDWLRSARAQTLITGYHIDGRQVFTWSERP